MNLPEKHRNNMILLVPFLKTYFRNGGEMKAPIKDQVLLADDDWDHGILFGIILKKVNPLKKLCVVHDGEELLAFLSKNFPEILFLDLHMPCKNGLECLQEIRLLPELEGLKIVVYSSSDEMTDIQKSYLHKADLYMVKPFNSEHLKNALNTILKEDWWQKQPPINLYFMNNHFMPFTATG
jgi:CheY-like chemotaxis protein